MSYHYNCKACHKSIKFENEAWKVFVAQITNDAKCPHCDSPLTPPSVFTQTLEHTDGKNLYTVLIKPTVNQQLTTDLVSSPPHYTSSKIECIDAIMSAVEGLDPQEAVHVANIMKYVWRFKRKNGKQDLEKAQWYLKRLIDLQVTENGN